MESPVARLLKRWVSRPDPVPRRPGQQPVPNVNDSDVERVVRRDFPLETAIALDIVKQYESARCGPRVQLGALMLAHGNLEELRTHIQYAATRDYRDVLVAAEYPEYGRAQSRARKLSDEERSGVYERDWRQYEEWLKK